jgi:hypothetical protein
MTAAGEQPMYSAVIVASGCPLTLELRASTDQLGVVLLAFAPTAGLDLWKNIHTDAAGVTRLDGRQFLIDSAEKQSGNALGFVGGLVAVALLPAAVTGAPVILIGLGAGIVVQLLWNWAGGSEVAKSAAEQALR